MSEAIISPTKHTQPSCNQNPRQKHEQGTRDNSQRVITIAHHQAKAKAKAKAEVMEKKMAEN
jgi:hypothetical protein